MKFAIIQILLLVLSSASASVAGSIPGAAWKQRNDVKRVVSINDRHISLDTRQDPVTGVVVAIGAIELAAIFIGWLSHQLMQQTQTAKPDSNNPN